MPADGDAIQLPAAATVNDALMALARLAGFPYLLPGDDGEGPLFEGASAAEAGSDPEVPASPPGTACGRRAGHGSPGGARRAAAGVPGRRSARHRRVPSPRGRGQGSARFGPEPRGDDSPGESGPPDWVAGLAGSADVPSGPARATAEGPVG